MTMLLSTHSMALGLGAGISCWALACGLGIRRHRKRRIETMAAATIPAYGIK